MAWSIFNQGGGDAVAVAWAKQLLQMIGAPVTPGNEEFIYQWEKSEGGGGAYNPLNQGPVPGNPTLTTSGSQYGGGAADYASWQAGLQGSADYLSMSNYTSVLTALKANNPVAARSALWASPWASSHYGYGADWSNATLPGNTSNVLPTAFATAATTGATSNTAASSTSTCAFNVSLSVLGNDCLMSMTEARALVGGLAMMAGATIFIVGALVLVAYGLSSTGAGKAAMSAAGAIPGVGGTAAKVAGNSAGSKPEWDQPKKSSIPVGKPSKKASP
jgi:hypothetical protein